MKAAYIGILTPGTTSRMRAECLRDLTPDWSWQWVDTDKPMKKCGRFWRSMAFRAKAGPAVDAVNRHVDQEISVNPFDWLWVDKGVFLRRNLMLKLRQQSVRLVHYTPDTAFHSNYSEHFNRSMELYDLLVTTKSFELDSYHLRTDSDRVLLTTQGFDGRMHFPRNESSVRRREVVFVGLAEPDREKCLDRLLENEIPVRLAGMGWGRFLRRWRGCRYLRFEGDRVFGDAYAAMLSESWVGLGLLSKRFPELHTTRTFEIPACGGILATERTADTERFFDQNEVLFFSDYSALAAKLKTLFLRGTDEVLAGISNAGHARVLRDRRDYASILREVLNDARLPPQRFELS